MQSDTVVAQSTLRRPEETEAPGDLTEKTSVEGRRRGASRVIAPRSGSPKKSLRVHFLALLLHIRWPPRERGKKAFNQAPSLGGGTGVSAFLATNRARIDRQVAYPAAKEKAKAASSASWLGYEEWKETKSLEVCTKTGAVASITWDRGDEGTRDALSPGLAARRRHAIHYFFVEVFGAIRMFRFAWIWAALE